MDKEIVDPDLKYCPVCKDEYRPEIERCAFCEENLLSGAELLAGKKTDDATKNLQRASTVINDGDTLVSLQGGSLLDMKRLKGLLAAEEVPAVLVKEDSCASSGCGGPRIIVQIREQDLQRAAVLLRQDHARTTVISDYQEVTAEAVFNPEAAMASCPACGHQFTPEGAECPECGLRFL
ncbi:MAG TPA: hypothetical protein VJ969_01920 [Desulfopila sp.]|nr:hypothetical protein [Desulfopila sp.]